MRHFTCETKVLKQVFSPPLSWPLKDIAPTCHPPDQPALDVEGLEFGAVARRIQQDDILHRDIHEPVRVKDLEQQ